MDKSKGNKRNRIRKNDDEINGAEKKDISEELSDKYILKNYLDKNIDELSSAELKKLKNYIDLIRSLLKNKGSQNFESLVKIADENVKRNF